MRKYKKSIAIGSENELEHHFPRISPAMKKIDTISNDFCKAAECNLKYLKYQGENKKSQSPTRPWKVWRKGLGSEQNYSILNLKGSVNESKSIKTPRLRNLRRIPVESRELSLNNWQKRKKKLPTNEI